MSNYESQRQALISYLQLMVSRSDWHGVSDAANDLRVLEAEHLAQLRFNQAKLQEKNG